MRERVALCLIICFLLTLAVPVKLFAEEISADAEINMALEWLVKNQTPEGYWGENSMTAIVDTSEIAEYLKLKGVKEENLRKAQGWLDTIEITNNDFAGRVLPYTSDVDKHESILSDVV